LPVWQSLFDQLKDHAFTVLAVAMDQPQAARPWIEAAAPAYPCLIDREHHLADLTLYFDAVRDWARRGAASTHALDDARAAAKLSLPDATVAEAHAHFHLGQQLLRQGQADEAQAQMAEAIRLHPDSWAMWRQAAAKNERGLAAGPEFWARVDALGTRPYYAPVDIAAGPDPS